MALTTNSYKCLIENLCQKDENSLLQHPDITMSDVDNDEDDEIGRISER